MFSLLLYFPLGTVGLDKVVSFLDDAQRLSSFLGRGVDGDDDAGSD